jgi:membrane protease YdiL (CAAX protease family)
MRIDRALGAAILAAPLFWLTFYLTVRPELNLLWPLQAPGKFLLLALLYPILEELAFRGFLQGWLADTAWGGQQWRGLSVANAVTSAVFATAHLYSHPWQWAATTFFPSLVFGFFRDRYRRLGVPIGLHVFYNGGYYWLFGAA